MQSPVREVAGREAACGSALSLQRFGGGGAYPGGHATQRAGQRSGARGGCYVDTINPFPVGGDVKIHIVKDNASFVAQARVLYASSGMGMGLAFTKIEPERLRVLEEWLRELSGESPRALKA